MFKPTKTQILKAAERVSNKGGFTCTALTRAMGYRYTDSKNQMCTAEYINFYGKMDCGFNYVTFFGFLYDDDYTFIPQKQRKLLRSLALLLYAEARDDV